MGVGGGGSAFEALKKIGVESTNAKEAEAAAAGWSLSRFKMASRSGIDVT